MNHSDINSVTILGTVAFVALPDRRRERPMLAVQVVTLDHGRANRHFVQLWGDLAVATRETICVGDRVVIEGRLGSYDLPVVTGNAEWRARYVTRTIVLARRLITVGHDEDFIAADTRDDCDGDDDVKGAA